MMLSVFFKEPVESATLDRITVDFKKFKPEIYQEYVSEGGVFLESGRAGYQEAKAVRQIQEQGDFTFYEIAELINRYTHLPCTTIESVIARSDKTREDFVASANKSPALIPFIIQEVLKSAYQYEERTETVEEELELTKLYPFKISVQRGRTALIVSKEKEEQDGHTSRLGFHISPYNFDSADEKDLFRYLRDILNRDEAIKDIYFTGGVTDTLHNDFYFEYWSPEKQRIARYFPDFLIETTRDRFLVVEVKMNAEQPDYEANKKMYKGRFDQLSNEVFAKEVGFSSFQEANKNFQYHIIFNATAQQEQVKLFQLIRQLK